MTVRRISPRLVSTRVPATGVGAGAGAAPFQTPFVPLSYSQLGPAHQLPLVFAMNPQKPPAWAWLPMTTVLKEGPGSVVGSAP